jgi:hypothetical protein
MAGLTGGWSSEGGNGDVARVKRRDKPADGTTLARGIPSFKKHQQWRPKPSVADQAPIDQAEVQEPSLGGDEAPFSI